MSTYPFGQVIPVVGTNLGFLGQASRTGERVIVARQANAANTNNIVFGDPVVTMPDTSGGTFRQLGDFLANGGAASITTITTTSGSATATVGSTQNLAVGMLVSAAGVVVGTTISAITSATAITLSINASSSQSAVPMYVAELAGIAVREVKTQLTYPQSPTGAPPITSYAPGDMTEVLQVGSITVSIPVGTPETAGQVYYRIATNGTYPAGVVGDLETGLDFPNVVAFPNCVFRTGVLDANNVAEITLTKRNTA